MQQLHIYRVQDRYINYLHGADHRVQLNKNASRPYVGVVLTVGSYRYFVPMESPKENHKKLRPAAHIMLLDGGKYGLLGFNNMIPVPQGALISFRFSELEDTNYANLLKRQAYYINKHKCDVQDHASKTYFYATSKEKTGFFQKVCCDFKKLELACKAYDPNYVPKERTK